MKKFIKIAKFVLFAALACVLLYFAFRGLDMKSIWSSIKQANYWWFTLSAIFGLIGYYLRAARWILIMEPLGYKPSNINGYHAVTIGYLANFAFPRLGEITRCATLNRSDKIPLDKLFGTVIIERIIDMLVLIILTVIVFFIKIDFFGKFLSDNIFAPIYNAIASLFQHTTVIVGASAVALLIIAGLFIFRKKIFRNKLALKVKNFAGGIASGMKSVIKMKRIGLFLLYTVIIWTIYFFLTYFIFFSIPATSELTPIDGLFILIISGVGVIVPVQGGIGAYHYFISLALTLYGISRVDGLVFATLSHGSQAIMTIIAGFISLFFVYSKYKPAKKTDDKA